MRLLVLSPYLPAPPRSGGAARIHGLISNLGCDHEVAILAFARPGEDLTEARRITGAYANEIVTVENPNYGASAVRKRASQALSLASRRSYEQRTHALPVFQAALDRLCLSWRPDAVVIEFAQMGYFRFPERVPLILDAHNVEHEVISRTAAIEISLLRGMYSRANAAKLRRDEANLLRRVDAAAVTSQRDLDVFRRLVPGARLAIVPNGVATDLFVPAPAPSGDPSLLFFGAMDYFPNVDAILHFYRDIWPALRASYPNLRLRIVGRLPPESVKDLASQSGIDVVGEVDDVRPWLADADAVIVPLRAGSGTRLKVLESLAMARPVVSTSLGVEGLEVEAGRHLLVADEPHKFAHAVMRVLDDPQFAELLGAEGRRLVERRYDWKAIAEEFERVIRHAVDAKPGARSSNTE